MSAPRVILFDLDDTVFRHSDSVAAGVLAHRRAHGGPMADAHDETEIARWVELEEHHYHRYLRGEIGFLDQRRARARAFVEPYAIDLATDDAADAWFTAYLEEYRRTWRLYDDTMPALDALDARIPGVRFGIVTNAVLAFQTQKLDAVGLRSRVEHIVASGELGVAKPDPKIFVHACELFGVAPSDAVYVGDRLETDAIGAATAGLHGVWLCRQRVPVATEVADAAASGVSVIRSLDELPPLLAGYSNPQNAPVRPTSRK